MGQLHFVVIEVFDCLVNNAICLSLSFCLMMAMDGWLLAIEYHVLAKTSIYSDVISVCIPALQTM